MSVLTDLRNRGVKDVFFVVCDGLKGLPEVVSNVWPEAIVQTDNVTELMAAFAVSASITESTTRHSSSSR